MRKHARELPEHAREHARELLDRDKRKDELDVSFEVGTPCTVSQFRFGGVHTVHTREKVPCFLAHFFHFPLDP